jgi:Holliday junction resolvase RusA-like endonuclease
MSDNLSVLALALGARLLSLRSAIIPGDPVAKGRPRMSRTGRAYTPARTRQAESDLAVMLRVERGRESALDGPVVLVARFWRGSRRRLDIDNLSKLLLDSGTKAGLWLDDSQIVAHATLIGWDKAQPRTELVWGPMA